MVKIIIGILSAALLICICYITYSEIVRIPKIKQDSVLENILNRKSVRNYVKGKEVTDEQIEKILKAGMAAPSARIYNHGNSLSSMIEKFLTLWLKKVLMARCYLMHL